MKILAIDTAIDSCSVALVQHGRILAEETCAEKGQQAEKLVPIIENLLKKTNLTYQDIGLLAVAIGPGSFTGVRIGMAVIKGIALVTGIPIIGITTLEIFAWQARNSERSSSKKIYMRRFLGVFARRNSSVCSKYVSFEDKNNDKITHRNHFATGSGKKILVIQNAMRGQVYTQLFSSTAVAENVASLVDVKDIPHILPKDDFIIAHNCSHIIDDNIPHTEELSTNAASVAVIAEHKFKQNDAFFDPVPFYIRPPDAKLPAT